MQIELKVIKNLMLPGILSAIEEKIINLKDSHWEEIRSLTEKEKWKDVVPKVIEILHFQEQSRKLIGPR